MQRFKVEDQVQLAHVLEEVVQALDKDVDEIKQGQRTLGRSGDDDEVERCVVAVGDERGRVVGLGLRC